MEYKDYSELKRYIDQEFYKITYYSTDNISQKIDKIERTATMLKQYVMKNAQPDKRKLLCDYIIIAFSKKILEVAAPFEYAEYLDQVEIIANTNSGVIASREQNPFKR